MRFVEDPDYNATLAAGSNPNTISIKQMLCVNPNYPNPVDGTPILFHAVRFEFEEEEKAMIKEFINNSCANEDQPLSSKQLDLIIASLPKLWMNCMHGFFPVILSVTNPLHMGYQKVNPPSTPLEQEEKGNPVAD